MHPTLKALIAAERVWQTEYEAAANTARIRAGDYRYTEAASRLPSYAAYETARTNWHEAGRPINN